MLMPLPVVTGSPLIAGPYPALDANLLQRSLLIARTNWCSHHFRRGFRSVAGDFVEVVWPDKST